MPIDDAPHPLPSQHTPLRIFLQVLGVAAGGAILASAALRNGFPLIYFDSGSYVAMSIHHRPLLERPVGYGLFIAATGAQKTLWGAIVAQCLILFWLIYQAFARFTSVRRPMLAALAATVILRFATTASYTAGTLLPDALAPILVLSLALLAAASALPRAHLAVLGALIVLANVTHLSHLLISGLFAALALAIAILFRWRRISSPLTIARAGYIAGVVGASWLCLLAVNLKLTHRLFVSESSSIFLVAKFGNNGVLNRFFDHRPNAPKYSLYKSKDRFPMNSDEFLWRDASISPLAAAGGWRANKSEYDRMVRDILSTPQCLGYFAVIAVHDAWKQFFAFDNSGFTGYLNRPEVTPQLEKFYPSELPRYAAAQQQRGMLQSAGGRNPLAPVNLAQRAIVAIALMAVIGGLVFRPLRELAGARLRMFATAILALCAINALVCGGLSAIISRYQERVIWLLGLVLILAITQASCRVPGAGIGKMHANS